MTTQTARDELFTRTMDAIEAHYRSRSAAEFVIPAEFALDEEPKVPDAAQDAVAEYQARTQGSLATQQEHVTDKSSAYVNGSISADDFDKAMDAQEDAEQEESAKRIHEMYIKLKEAGHEHPEQQSAILAVTKVISKFTNELLDKVTGFFVEIAKKISEWVSEAFKKIGEFFGDAFGSVESFFGSIF